ncbi:lysosomal Pro-X carboxypeptidase-like [Asparagus officinalis]|uniref:lysosomal Pro-X carboxypeptidase-like n=1 Tax=Asparagus officinalis TaxID=4686 RepID=UPI00098DED9F|nr:lysosomal Pro-X carboxypeptidase-like [Asparagus officinalis]
MMPSITFLFSFFFLLQSLYPSLLNAAISRFPAGLIGSKPLKKSDKVTYDVKYFTQTLDHFNYQPQSYETFQQKYLFDDRHWGGLKSGSPIFVYTGNEGDIELFAENTGFLFDIAPYFKALIVFMEHRYYGESIPFCGDKNVAFQNATTLGYLSTTQALADFATLIIDLKKNLTAEGSPVVVFGGSYGGMLAAWFRLKYPHVAIGALASSAPILQFDDIVSPYAFSNIITKDFRSESENCYKILKNSWDALYKTAKQRGGVQKLTKSFHICKGLVPDEYLPSTIKNWIEYSLIYVAMTDYPTASKFLSPLPGYPVKKMCEAIDNPTAGSDIFARLYGAMNVYYNNSGDVKCFDPTTYGTDAIGTDAWSWQSCTELILPNGANNEESIFPVSTYNYTDEAAGCKETYNVTPRQHAITTEYGGHDVRRVLKRFASNIIFFNGLRDPWSGGGVLKSLSNSLIAIVEPKGWSLMISLPIH